MKDLFILLLAAHAYGDFLLQSDWMAREKGRLPVLLLHVLIHGALAYVLVQQWGWWQVPLGVVALHLLIDGIKNRCPGGPTAFAVDQAAHVLSLAVISWAATHPLGLTFDVAGVWGFQWIVLGAGLSAAVLGAGHFIREVAERMTDSDEALREALQNGVPGGGAQIGRLERALIFILLGIGQPAGIGFLIAAKSILRFEEAKRQKLAEYVLIGTLWSFSLAIVLAWLTLTAIDALP
ncbi:MAG: hypothetical protein E1N59_1629 [Puniceicoccaceae bacterium 5H]|nr:MAG: hypothetical protein E1N59_1629 [Puniceicoccaceae bacterium 5H]